MALLNTLKNLFLLAVVGVSVLLVLANIKDGTIATTARISTAPTQTIECGAAGDPCVLNGRHYNVLLPEGEGRFPVFLFFHGSASTGDRSVTNSLLVGPALARGYAVIAPTALNVEYGNGTVDTGWVINGRQGSRDDYRFTRNVITDAETRFPIDTSRILTAGHSMGATYIWYMSCAAIDFRLSAFAPIGGTLYKGNFAPCDDMRPRYNLMHTHGTSDLVMPHNGRSNAIRIVENLGLWIR